MKLRRLKVSEFRWFSNPVEIRDLADGLNLFHGPNECGKSTLAQALRTVFFEKHKTKGEFVSQISPKDQQDAAPAIEVDFQLGDQPASLQKQFFKRPRAFLSIGSETWDGDAADNEIANRLGFQLAGRGASGADDRGIPGLLWIEQGRSPELVEPVKNARATMQERLKDIIGEVTSTNGNVVMAAVAEELGKLRTATGRETGALRDTRTQHEQAIQELEALQRRFAEYREKVDALGRALQSHRQLHRDRPWVKLESDLNGTRTRLESLAPKQKELQSRRSDLSFSEQRFREHTEERERHARDLEALARHRQELESLSSTLSEAQAALQHAEAQRAATQGRLVTARSALQAAQQQALRDQLEETLKRVKADITRLEALVNNAGAAQRRLDEHRTKAAACQSDTQDLEHLRELETDLREQQIRIEAAATRLDFRTRDGASIETSTWGTVQGTASHHATEPVMLRIEGVGEIDIVPGGEAVQQYAGQRDLLAAERKIVLSRLGVPDIETAESRHAEWLRLDREAQNQEQALAIVLDGRSLDDWRAELQELIGQQTKFSGQLAVLPAVGTAVMSLADAHQLHDQAEQDHQDAIGTKNAANESLTQARIAHESLAATIGTEASRLESAEAKSRDADLVEALDALEVNILPGLREQIATLEAALQAEDAEGLQRDIDRLEKSLRQAKEERDELDTSLRDLKAYLNARGAEGLEEQIDQTSAKVERLGRRLTQYALRAEGLQLLADKLSARQTAAKERLYAPLRAKLEPYLRIVFPGVSLHMGIEDLAPTDLQRGEQRLGIEEFSHGTREQLGVLARFAYADLLKDANQPTLLVLDDALVHSDMERLEKMKRAVHLAAQRHQVLLFTCHPDSWRDAGADRRIDVAALRSNS